MGKLNKQRRAAKQRRRQEAGRAKEQRPSRAAGCPCPDCSRTPPRSASSGVDAIVAVLVAAGEAAAAGDRAGVATRVQELAGPGSRVDADLLERAAQVVLTGTLAGLWAAGWQPRDVHQVARRRLTGPHADLTVAVLAHEAAQYAASALDPRWSDQLAEVGARGRPSGDRPLLASWAARSGSDPVQALSAVLELLGLLLRLPPLQVLLPPPGSSAVRRPSGPSSDERSTDQRALARVRALLAKAEATDFPDEAEALSAKAQELMAKHSLDRLLVEAGKADREPVSAQRFWVEAPYPGEKALLVDVVARANRCTAVWAQELGFVTVIGDERDLVATELLVTSLLLQATRAMVDRGRAGSAGARSRSRSFRQSFLVAYASRIGERLDGAAGAAARAAAHVDLLPVLAAESERVADARAALFPEAVTRGVTVSDSQGYVAGRVAADFAQLGHRSALMDDASVG